MEAGAGVADRDRVTRLLLDEMYPIELAANLRAKGFDALAVLEVDGLPASSDLDLLSWARQDDRCIVTENVEDFARLSHGAHNGVLLVRARRWPRTGAGLARLESGLVELLSSEIRMSPDTVDWL